MFCNPDYPHTGNGWGVLGGDSDPGPGGSTAPASLSTNVSISGTPATLSFYTRVIQGSTMTTAFLQASIDGTPIGPNIASTDPNYSTYKLVTADAAAFADGASHVLSFGYTGSATSGLLRHEIVLDDVSLQIPDPPPTPEPTPTPTPTPEPTPTPTPEPQPTVPTCHGKPATKLGTDEPELIEGTPKADVIIAGAGDDVIRTGAGDDTVCAGAGNDELKGASGNDRLYGEEGRDKLNGGGGSGDKCVGGPSRDKATRSCEKQKTL
jgi:hypothetical protein